MSPFMIDESQRMKTRIDDKAINLFQEKDGKPSLQVTRVRNRGDRINEDQKRKVDVRSASELKQLKNDQDDSYQIFTIQQEHTWTTMDISRRMFEDFMETYDVMHGFWKHVFAFGCKSEENEFQFPQFTRRRTITSLEKSKRFESAYILRRVELNGQDTSNGAEPWSIRQTGIYDSLSDIAPPLVMGTVDAAAFPGRKQRSSMLLIAPSPVVEKDVQDYLNQSSGEESSWIICLNIHRILVADSMTGWLDYMASLEARLHDRANRLIYAEVKDDKANLSPLTNFEINFEDRQEVKIVEDLILDLQVILPTVLNAITGIYDQFKYFRDTRELNENELSEVDTIMWELEEYIKEAEMHVERAHSLKEKAKSTAQLLSDYLAYDEAVSLKCLAEQTREESKATCELARQSTKDAAAVKILTVIMLIYLPFTIVANFFSTEFVQSDQDHMHIMKNVWILAVVAVPLTVFTILIWYLWVHFTAVEPVIDPAKPGVVMLQRAHSFRDSLSGKKKKQKTDLETGLASPQSPTYSHPKPGITWSSTATTVKSQKSG